MMRPSVTFRFRRLLTASAVMGAVGVLFPMRAAGSQLTEAINRARKAADQGNQRTQAIDQQSQQATQSGTKAPAPAAPVKGASGAAPQQGTPAAAAPRKPLPVLTASTPSSGMQVGGPGTHTVGKGETLWGIAQRYLNDPYLWPELYRINTDVVEDPRWIYPGEVLRLPGAPSSTPATVAAAVQVGAPGAAAPVEQEAEPPEGSTIFSAFRRNSGTSRRQAFVSRPAPAVRSGEFTSAPYVAAANGPAWSGRVLEVLSGNSIDADRRDRAIQIAEPVSLTPPSGTPPQAGTRYLVIRPGGAAGGLGTMVVPTGVIVVDQVERGKSPVAHVTQVFDVIRAGQGLIPFERIVIDSASRPAKVANGPMSSVAWVQNGTVVPTIQSFVVLHPKGLGIVRPGDVFALLRPLDKTVGGASLPEETVATVQAVRVTPQGITAVLTSQTTGEIRAGMSARLAARMPAP